MSTLELLNNVTHQDLKVRHEYSVELGDNVASSLTFITEYAEVQKNYPILFRQVPGRDDYQSVALFGFIQNENLFLSKEHCNYQVAPGWNANYIPAAVARGPFSIVYQQETENGEKVVSPMIQVDLDHPKITSSAGENVFLEQGGNSPYLEKVSENLNIIRDGAALDNAMFKAFDRCGLIQTLSIDIDLVNKDKHRISGFYTIDADKLATLKPDDLELLSKSGFLQAAYFVVASLSNLKHLIEIKNRSLRSLYV